MNHMEFTAGMDRLRNVFGDRAYSDERVKLIFRMVQHESSEFWVKAVDQLILSCRQPPLSTEIGELLSLERERKYFSEKQQHKQEADNWPEFIPQEEKKMLFEAIRKRISGNMSDPDWECVLKIIASIPKMPLKEGA